MEQCAEEKKAAREVIPDVLRGSCSSMQLSTDQHIILKYEKTTTWGSGKNHLKV